MLPPEIWEEILMFMDPIELLRKRTVCRTWNSIITKMLKKSTKWFTACQKDVPIRYWTVLLEHEENPEIFENKLHDVAQSSEKWATIYKHWYQWSTLVHRVPTITKFKPLPVHRIFEHITCVRASCDFIAIGSSIGYIYFYQFHFGRDSLIFVADHTDFIVDIQIWRYGNNVIAVSISRNRRIKYWDVHLKEEVFNVAVTVGRHIATSLDYYYTVSKTNFNEYKVHIEHRTPSNIERWSETHNMPEKIVAAGANGDELILWTNGNIHFQICVKGVDKKITSIMTFEPNLSVRNYYIFKPFVVACIGDMGELGFSINGRDWKLYCLFSFFQATVSAVHYHGSNLLIGLDSGDLVNIHVKDESLLENLEFEMLPYRKLMLDSDPIIAISVTSHDFHQYIIAATVKTVHILTFK